MPAMTLGGVRGWVRRALRRKTVMTMSSVYRTGQPETLSIGPIWISWAMHRVHRYHRSRSDWGVMHRLSPMNTRRENPPKKTSHTKTSSNHSSPNKYILTPNESLLNAGTAPSPSRTRIPRYSARCQPGTWRISTAFNFLDRWARIRGMRWTEGLELGNWLSQSRQRACRRRRGEEEGRVLDSGLFGGCGRLLGLSRLVACSFGRVL